LPDIARNSFTTSGSDAIRVDSIAERARSIVWTARVEASIT
jgi:hypothetical protein